LKQVIFRVISKGEPIKGLYRPHGRSIRFSQVVRLNNPAIAREAKPGQFVMLNCGPDCVLPRPFSIHQVINKEDILLYFAVLENGKGTDWLSQRREGDVVEVPVPKPLGNGFSIDSTSKNLLLAAGGMGIAPLYFLAEEATNQGYSVTLLYGTAIENPYPEASPKIKVVKATEDGSVGYQGLITDLIPDFVNWADQVFACGPLGMYRAMAQMPELKKKPVQVSLEVNMACGRGICYGCTVRTKHGLKQVCQDGPVFDLNDILWNELPSDH